MFYTTSLSKLVYLFQICTCILLIDGPNINQKKLIGQQVKECLK